ncbi:hypothetical protein BCR34DRAFT_623222 [Clohesyomyces aquaticus]|uniref:F-box domain-containing protein n=1 Tax=Clohesyomyces aquaticus TaxID=1231657 RepID=A0A1Y1ZWI9_9PLEO|nr:hypothetical protein BCR34DRAFT_623222 [Clohesyomyces aquaticus]
MPPGMSAFSNLPNEILSHITSHLERPADVVGISLSSRRLREFVKLDGWRAFLRGRFGLAGLDLDARNSVHGITTLCRNWDRKAFVARYLAPSHNVDPTSLITWEYTRWRGSQGQTMGYQPSMDSYEESHGIWANRREVLAWSAGTHLVFRMKEMGSKAAKAWEACQDPKTGTGHGGDFDEYKYLSDWYTYKIPESSEGRDDITTIRLLRPHQRNADLEAVALGTASGYLSLLSFDPDRRTRTEQVYETDDRSVGSLSLSFSKSPLMATTLGDSTLALFPTRLEDSSIDPIQPSSQVAPMAPGAQPGRIWSCYFISENLVAVGLGPSHEPIQVYEIAPTGLSTEPIRKFNLDTSFWNGEKDDWALRSNTSVYPIIPIPPASQGGSASGHVFLSGGFDGVIRLHDMRSPRPFETIFWDVTNYSSIYSLATQGLERVVAGTSMHSMLKVFDMRVSGSHAYHHISIPSTNTANNEPPKDVPVTGGWNLYLNPRNPPRQSTPRAPYHRTSTDSPIYSLSIPSSTSPSVYAGLEGAVMGLDFLSVIDKHPDPIFATAITRFPDTGRIDVKRSYNAWDNSLNFGMYEQGTEKGAGLRLMVQEGVAERTGAARETEYWRER